MKPRVAHRSTFWERMMKSSIEKKMRSNSDRKNSWVMLAESGSGGYTPLPGEQTLYQSPPRTTLSLQTSHSRFPSESYSQQCKSGVVYLTNRRVRLYSTVQNLTQPCQPPTKANATTRSSTSPLPQARPSNPSPSPSYMSPTHVSPHHGSAQTNGKL